MLDFVLSAPVLVKVLGALLLILVVNRFCPHLLVSIGCGALALGLWAGYGPGQMAGMAWGRFISANNLMLMLVVLQVIWLSSQMATSGVMEDLVGAVRHLVSRRNAMAVLPAVIGFLPMPGGALFSAPLVGSVDVDGVVEARLKAQTNHWFRHVWEYWWPIYPGVLLAVDLTGLQIWQMMLIGIPLTLAAMAGGHFFLLRHVPRAEGEDSRADAGGPHLLRLVLPIAVVIGCYAAIRGGYGALRAAYPGLGQMNRYLPMAVGLFAAMAVLQRQRPLGRREWRDILLSRRALNMAAIVAVVRIYGAYVEGSLPGGTTLVGRMHAEMDAWGIPTRLMVMALPFVSGLATGISVGFVGASFPIVIPLMAGQTLGSLLSVTALAYASGFMGVMLSPVHVCLVVTSQHFDTRVLPNALSLARPAAVVIAAGLALHLLL